MATVTDAPSTEVQGVITPMQVPASANQSNGKGALEKLESILASPQYMEMMESCKNFNKRLLMERRGRVPFIDAHTGLAQSDCSLWMEQRHRMPGVKPGQVYTYPAKRWVKRRRQYLNFFMQPKKFALEECELAIAAVQNPTFTEDSNTSINEGSKDGWFYEDAEIDREDFEDNSDNSDFDFDDRYRKKKKPASTQKRSSGRSSSSRRRTADPEEEAKKPWACERSRGGRASRQAAAAASAALSAQADMDKFAKAPPPPPPPPPPQQQLAPPAKAPPPPPAAEKPDQAPVAGEAGEQAPGEKKRTAPSVYCDFCLGDAALNKKTGTPEDLVSCSDCGRSGHPTCLQFTDNMVISVKKYRWQCIECKCCSLCGTSDNDDQLLFCDDCDRGYHMYCLSPPLTEPPEGSWSCHLCVCEFHDGVQPASVPQAQ